MVRKHSDRVRTRRERESWRGKSPSKAEWRAFCCELGDVCLSCGAAGVELTRDHIVPLSEDGKNDLSNLQPLCPACNVAKATERRDLRPAGYTELLRICADGSAVLHHRVLVRYERRKQAEEQAYRRASQ